MQRDLLYFIGGTIFQETAEEGTVKDDGCTEMDGIPFPLHLKLATAHDEA